MKNCILPILLSVLLAIAVLAQSTSQQQLHPAVPPAQKKTRPSLRSNQAKQDKLMFRTAQGYLNMGRYEMAIRILQDLLKRYPDNISYYRTLLRAYLLTSRLAEADSLINVMIPRHPGDFRLLIDRGLILYKKGEKDTAMELWKQVLNENPRNLDVVQQVANAMLQNRLYDDAIRVYEHAILEIPRSEHLYQNIANLYRNRLMFSQAARYYLLYLEKYPKREKYVFSQILSFNVEPEEREEFFKSLEKYARKSSDRSRVYLLMAQLYQRYREFEKAFQLYQRLEQETTDEKYLLEFANAAQQDSSYRIALQAYQMVVEKYPRSAWLADAYIGVVNCLFQLARLNNEEQYARQALEWIEKARNRFPKNPRLPALRYLEGIIYLDYFFDVDGAASVFMEIIRMPRASTREKNRAMLKLGDCFLIKGQLAQALQIFEKIKHPSRLANALLQIARTYYFMKEWDKSGEFIEKVIKQAGMKGEVTNDALALQMRIAGAREVPEVLDKLSEADLLLYQRKKSEARKKYTDILKIPNVPVSIKSDVYLQLAQLSLDLKEYSQALDYCTQAIQDSSLKLYTDQHLFLMANILETHLNRPQKAFEIYQQLLENYPYTLLADQARDRMKNIKESKLEKILP